MVKYILLALFDFFFSNRGKFKSAHNFTATTETIIKDLRDEITGIGFKLLVGIVLTSVVIFSVIQVGQALQLVLSQTDAPLAYQILIFSFIALVGGISMYLLFKENFKRNKPELKAREAELVNPISPKAVIFEFADGFADKFVSNLNTNNFSSRRNNFRSQQFKQQ